MLVRPAFRRQRCRFRLDDQAQLEEGLKHMLVGIRLEHPGEDIRVKQMPFFTWRDARPDFGTGNDETFCGEHSHSLTISCAGNMMPFTCRELGFEQFAWTEEPGNNLHTQIPGQLAMNPKTLRIRRRRFSHFCSWSGT